MPHLFIDLRNTYLQCKKHYGARVDLSAFEGYFRKIMVSTFVGKASGFYTKASSLGYIVEAKFSNFGSSAIGKRDAEVSMMLVVKVLEYLDDLEEVHLVTNNETLIPFIKWLQGRGIVVKIISPYVSDALLEVADAWIRLDERYLLPAE